MKLSVLSCFYFFVENNREKNLRALPFLFKTFSFSKKKKVHRTKEHTNYNSRRHRLNETI